MAWEVDFELDIHNVLEEEIWSEASTNQLVGIRISDFIELGWEWEMWYNELIARFGYIKDHPRQKYWPVNSVERIKIADCLFEVIHEEYVSQRIRSHTLLHLDPQTVMESMFDFPPSSNMEFWDELIHWAEINLEDGFIGIYADLILLVARNDMKGFVDYIREWINETDNQWEINMLMNILCHHVSYFAGEWGRTGIDPEDGDNIENIRRIVNSKVARNGEFEFD